MKLPKRVVLVGVIATATPGDDHSPFGSFCSKPLWVIRRLVIQLGTAIFGMVT